MATISPAPPSRETVPFWRQVLGDVMEPNEFFELHQHLQESVDKLNARTSRLESRVSALSAQLESAKKSREDQFRQVKQQVSSLEKKVVPSPDNLWQSALASPFLQVLATVVVTAGVVFLAAGILSPGDIPGLKR